MKFSSLLDVAKTCTACGDLKALAEFPPKREGQLRGRCYPCQAVYSREVRRS